jgi:aspartyl aminopeptidase
MPSDSGSTTTPADATRMLADLTSSPTPYHAVDRARTLLENGGFAPVSLDEPLPAGGRSVVAVGGLLIAWATPSGGVNAGFTVVGAHTDSPNLRVRTHPDVASAGWEQVGMEVYGGVLANSWLDRDLGLAGRVIVRSDRAGAAATDTTTVLVNDDRPLLRIPQLAIHLDREIRENGLLLDPQKHLVPLWGLGEGAPGTFAGYVAELAGVTVDQIVSWDLMAYDTHPPAIVGRDGDLIASARIDNLFSTFCGVHALIEVADEPGARVPVLVLYDHEEVGSSSATGAGGAVLSNVLERISMANGVDRAGHLEALARSYVVSADGAHATHPNYADKHEPNHAIAVNGGVVVKRNANQRYASDALSEAPFRAACAAAGVPVQTYIHRNDLPCGSTIGPITAARLGVPTVDVGAPQLAMHSIREMAGVADVGHLTTALAAMWRLL